MKQLHIDQLSDQERRYIKERLRVSQTWKFEEGGLIEATHDAWDFIGGPGFDRNRLNPQTLRAVNNNHAIGKDIIS